MKFDREKFKALVLYVVWRTSHMSGFGATKLNKALWFAEARALEAYGHPVSGETFVRDKHGPRSKHLNEICAELVEEGLVEPFAEPIYNYVALRYRALAPPEASVFSNEELQLIDWWVATIGEKHTAASISDLSHDYGWEVAKMGEELPLKAFLARRIRGLKTVDEIEWAQREAARLGL